MIVLVIMLLFIGLMIYSIGIALTIVTFLLGHWLRNTLRNYDKAINRTTPSKLKFVAYISLFFTAPSVFVYFYAHNSVVTLAEALIGSAVALVTFLQVIIYIVDIILKIICYYYAIKAIIVAKGTTMIEVPEGLSPRIYGKKSEITPESYAEAMIAFTGEHCPYCNAALINNSEFCPQCGCKIDMTDN